MKKSQIHKLKLVFPPISNQVAEWVKDDPDVKQILSQSKLYMIGQRSETFFRFDENLFLNTDHFTIDGEVFSDNIRSPFSIDVERLFHFQGIEKEISTNIVVEAGDKSIRIINKQNHEIIDWWTIEKLIHDKSKNYPFVKKLDNFREFTDYILHYVGISTQKDSLQRLVIQPHDKRLRILSNEYSKTKGSRLTDEIVLFFFDISTFEIKTFEKTEDFSDIGKITGEKEEIIADAEKAFVKIMNCTYNEVKFDSYPRSTDGLYKYDIDNYGFFIGESYSFATEDNIINGNYSAYDFDIQSKSDLILTGKDKVTLFKCQTRA